MDVTNRMQTMQTMQTNNEKCWTKLQPNVDWPSEGWTTKIVYTTRLTTMVLWTCSSGVELRATNTTLNDSNWMESNNQVILQDIGYLLHKFALSECFHHSIYLLQTISWLFQANIRRLCQASFVRENRFGRLMFQYIIRIGMKWINRTSSDDQH